MLVAQLVVVMLWLCGGPAAVDAKTIQHVKMHSLVPPILENYWDNGLHEWSFGAATVVTDLYVRLTQKTPTSRGYLWNRRSLQVDNFQFNATFRIANRDGTWFSDKSGSGIGFWLTSEAPRHVPVSFYGMTDQFTGVGVVFDHTNHVSVLFNNGQHLASPHDATVGTCQIRTGDAWSTFILRVSALDELLDVLVSVGGDAPVPCTRVKNVKLPSNLYIGITATNTESSSAFHDATMLALFPMAKPEEFAADAESPAYHHGDAKKEQEQWTGREDIELRDEAAASDNASAQQQQQPQAQAQAQPQQQQHPADHESEQEAPHDGGDGDDGAFS